MLSSGSSDGRRQATRDPLSPRARALHRVPVSRPGCSGLELRECTSRVRRRSGTPRPARTHRRSGAPRRPRPAEHERAPAIWREPDLPYRGARIHPAPRPEGRDGMHRPLLHPTPLRRERARPSPATVRPAPDPPAAQCGQENLLQTPKQRGRTTTTPMLRVSRRVHLRSPGRSSSRSAPSESCRWTAFTSPPVPVPSFPPRSSWPAGRGSPPLRTRA